MSMKAGIIGFGYMGHFHYKRSEELDVPVVAVYDIAEDKRDAAEKEGMAAYDSLDAFLADESFSLVYICTPNDVHAELSIAALRAGKNVMSEKPVAMSCRELEEVIRAARQAGKVFTVHQNRRWDVDYLTVKKVLESGVIGIPTSILSRVYGQRGVCFGWRADPAQGGGMLYDWGIHMIDQFLCMFPGHKVISVYARLQSILTPAVDDSFELQMKFDNGLYAIIQVGTFCLQELPRWFVYGDRGTLRLDDFSGEKGGMARIRKTVTGFDSVFGKPLLGPSRTMAPLQPEYLEKIEIPHVETDPMAYHKNLIAACEGLAEPYVSHRDMLRDMKIVDLAFESARLNQVIHTEI